jgi:hypothetical protein
MLLKQQLIGRNFERQLRTEKPPSSNPGKYSSGSLTFIFTSFTALIFISNQPLDVYPSGRRPLNRNGTTLRSGRELWVTEAV